MNRYNMTKQNGMGDVYARVNRLAHQMAMQEEPKIRTAILARISDAVCNGANISELGALLSKMESTGDWAI